MTNNNKNESPEQNESPEDKHQQSTESDTNTPPQGAEATGAESEPPKSESEAEDDELPKLILEEFVTGANVTLSYQQAGALSKWVITSGSGIQSADSMDDQQKVAFLMIVKALAYERDWQKRENIFMEIEKTVFHYTMAADNARERFIQQGLVNLDAMVKRGQMQD